MAAIDFESQHALVHEVKSRVELYRFDDRVDLIGDGDGSIGIGCAGDTAAAEDFVEFLLIGGVIGDRRCRVFELMAGQNANDAILHPDDPLLP